MVRREERSSHALNSREDFPVTTTLPALSPATQSPRVGAQPLSHRVRVLRELLGDPAAEKRNGDDCHDCNEGNQNSVLRQRSTRLFADKLPQRFLNLYHRLLRK